MNHQFTKRAKPPPTRLESAFLRGLQFSISFCRNSHWVSPVSWDQYSAAKPELSWQEPRQWILDQNNNIHRVLSQNRPVATTGPIEVEMIRPVPQMAPARVYFVLPPGDGAQNVVSHIWYIPAEVEIDSNGNGTPDLPVTLSVVYATVREL